MCFIQHYIDVPCRYRQYDINITLEDLGDYWKINISGPMTTAQGFFMIMQELLIIICAYREKKRVIICG